MAKLNVKGNSEMLVKADLMVIEIDFNGRASNTEDAMEKCQSQCETFLEEMEKICIKSESFTLDDNEIRFNLGDDRNYVEVKKKIKVKIAADIKLESYITKVIGANNFDCDYDLAFVIADEKKIEESLMKMAIEDSRKKAELMAAGIAQKIIDVEDIEEPSYYGGYNCYEKDKCLSLDVPSFMSKTPRSDKLDVMEIRKTGSINITWITE